MGKKSVMVASMAAMVAAAVQAKDIRDQWNIQISKAELVIADVAPHEAANAIRDAISQFAIPADLSFRAMPSAPPARPGTPQLKQVAQNVPSPEYVCDGAYAVIGKKPPPVQNAFAFIVEGHQICLYSFEKGVKAYVMYYNIKKLEPLTSGLFSGITRAIRGSDEERATNQLKGNIDDIRAQLPNLLVERIEIPGLPVETPDREAVAALIPPEEKVVAVVPSAPAAVALAQAAASTPLQLKVEARKNLTAMGMTYHSQQQFVEAIRRKDDVAVQLFLDGGGINLETPDSTGKTPLQIAQVQGSAEIVALLQPKLQTVATAPAATKPAVAVPALLQPARPGAAAVDFSQIPPELLAQMDEEVAKMNLSAEDSQLARANLARQYLKVKALADALKR
jgi:ankyrin repeat protein